MPSPSPSSISLKELVEFLARALVDNPDQVQVSEIAGEQTVVLELRVAQSDLGKVIGKQGRTVKAMRAILGAASAKLRMRAELEILE
ncbi:MAG: KH domain-containing protein [Nannocystaceae bacterium]|nr:KH domain-containing protein [Myxococcales bacterium]